MDRITFEDAKELYERLDAIDEDLELLNTTGPINVIFGKITDFELLQSIDGPRLRGILRGKLIDEKNQIQNKIENL